MESTVLFRDRQELQSADLNNAQDFARAAIDHVVNDAIETGKGYVGFSATKTAATEVTLSAGRLYAGGAVFARDDDVVIDLFNALPLVTKKRIALVAFGQPVDTDVQPRDFLIDAQLGTTEPQSVAMESHRRCEVSSVAGTESPDPSVPATDANVTVLAYLLLDTTGILSIEQWTPTQLPNLRLVANRVTSLELWRGQISGQVDTLRTDLSALADRMLAFALKNEVVDLTQQLEDLRKKVYEPGAYIYYGTDHFLTEEGSNPDHLSYDALVEEGVRFGEAGSATTALALLNPNNVYVTVNNGFVLPKYGHAVRMDLTGYSGETRMAQYTYETTEIRQLTRSRERRRYGASKEVCSNSAWWRQGAYDMTQNVFRRKGETWEVLNGIPDRMPNGQVIPNGNVHWIRLRQFWIDIYQEPYWERVTSTAAINGQQVAQTFLNSQDGWLSQVGLYFSRKAATGDVTVLVCETAFGMPDLTRVLSRTTVPVADIKVGSISGGAGLPSLVETKVVLPPTYLVAGRRYAIVCVTTGDHYVAMTNTDNGVVQGTFFVSTDGAFFAGNLVDDLKMRLYFAKFERTRLSVELTALQLAGGILDIDILNEGITPPACRTDFEVQVNGAWVPLDGEPNGPNLSGLPAILPLRVTLTGTTDLMPGFGLTGSEVIVSRPRTAFTWVGALRTLGSPSNSIKVIVDLQAYDEATHDCTVSLLTGADLSGSETADVIEDVTLPDGSIRRTSVFNVTAVSFYAVSIVGSTTSAAGLFHIGELIEFSQS
ncbi:hypothetical protein [Bauldia litoralis]|uniref:DUF4815 domain-containing protein n=1 Tax=Bauldia litoralis TaxID=665467 RepID=A0A1G6EJK6_9HYPH|nr:hypothetical protein [Bauldia litoralis]SDB57560.1 hypothetical protein SAMN02982931_04581 [Bauldia litoralis]